MRPSLFHPVFYTIVFGLAIASLYILNEQSSIIQALVTIVLVGIDLVLWLIYLKERKNYQSVDYAMNEAIERAEQGLEAKDRLSDEDWKTLSRTLKQLIGLFAWFIGLTTLCIISLQIRQIVVIPDIVFYPVLMMMGAGVGFVILFGILKWVEYRKLSKEIF